MSSIDTDEFRALLEQERERLTSAVGFLHAENSDSLENELGEVASGTDNHIGDTATATYDRELEGGLEEGAQHTLDEVEAALKRIEDGSYGTCQECGKPIGEDRLRALPWARYCIDDQRRLG